MAVALYRRYRPDTFEDLIGQEHVTDLLKNALDSGRSTHAYLFSGPRGCGKTTSARIMARCLNCVEGPTSTPCGVCPSCVELASGGPGSLDVVEIDAASNRGVDDARNLRERAAFSPSRDRYKIFILDEAHMVTKEGSNALLKIVEEPPEHVKFIFATTEPEKVIGTIRSRTHHYPFRLVGPQVMLPYLAELCTKEGVEVEPGVLDLVIRAGGGSVRDSLSVLDQLIAGSSEAGLTLSEATGLLGFTSTGMLEDLVGAVGAQDGFRVFQLVEEITRAGIDPTQLTKDLLQMMRDLLVCGLIPAQAAEVLPHIPEDQLARMLDQASTWGVRRLSRSADLVDEALRTMSGTMSDRLQLELLLGRLLSNAGDQLAAQSPSSTPPEQAAAKPPVQRETRPREAAPQQPAPAPSRPTEADQSAKRPQPDHNASKAKEPAKRTSPQGPAQDRPTQDRPAQDGPAQDGQDLQEAWDRLVAQANSVSRVTGVVAQGTKPVSFDGQTLCIEPSSAVKGRLSPGSPDYLNLERIAGQVFGVQTRLEISTGQAQTVAPKKTAETARPEVTSEPIKPRIEKTPAAESPAIESPAEVRQAAPAPKQTTREPEEHPDDPVWDGEVSADDATIKVAPNRGLPALLDVLGGTVVDQTTGEQRGY